MNDYPNELAELRQKYKDVSEHAEFLQRIIDAQEEAISKFKEIAQNSIDNLNFVNDQL